MPDSGNVIQLHGDRILSAEDLFERLLESAESIEKIMCAYKADDGEIMVAHNDITLSDMCHLHRVLGMYIDSEMFE